MMRKISLFAVAAALIGTASGFGVWAYAPTNAPIAASKQTIEPFQLMVTAKGLATTEFVDYTFVFN